MPLSTEHYQALAEVSINAYEKENRVNNYDQEKPLLKALMKKSMPLAVSQDGFNINIKIANNDNMQFVSGDGRVTYNTRNNDKRLTYDMMSVHSGFTLSEEFLYRNGIRVSDKSGLDGGTTYAERVQIVNILRAQLADLKEGQMEGVHRSLWLDGSQFADAKPGIDTLVSTTPTVGTIGGFAASNAIWQNGASLSVTATLAGFTTALAQRQREVMKRGGKITHFFAGGDMLDSLRSAAISANQTVINHDSDARFTFDIGSGEVKINGINVIYVPDFDTNFGLAAPPVPWAKRLYGLNLDDSISLHKNEEDFMSARNAGRPIDQYTFYMGMTSKFAISTRRRNSNFVMSIA